MNYYSSKNNYLAVRVYEKPLNVGVCMTHYHLQHNRKQLCSVQYHKSWFRKQALALLTILT